MITTKMRTYEAIVVFNPNTSDEALQDRLTKIQELANQHGGGITVKEVWGKRSLAYPIKNFKYGLFTVMNITAQPTFNAELIRVLRITDEVLRFSCVLKDKYSPDLDGRLKGDFTYGYRPPHSPFGSRDGNDDDSSDDDLESSDDRRRSA